MSINPLSLFSGKPTIAHHSISIDKGLTIHYRHDIPGALDAPQGLSHHMLTYFLSTNERQVTHFDECGEYDGVMKSGDFYLYPADRSGFTRWHSIDKTLHIVIKPEFLNKVARDAECISPEKIELLPVLKTRDRKLENLVQLFLTEIDEGGFGEKAYLESLSSLFGIQLLRRYCTVTPKFREYTCNGLAPYQLSVVLEYIQAHLGSDLSLDTMADQIGMSRCYFATQFKQSMGIAPHQYVNQQRIAQAKECLRSQKLSISDIAIECGFSNQSHLTKVFKQQTGTTPKSYLQQSR
ncbi:MULTISPECIES: AraC family transcriptional regulator [unclassified Microcoleus]|uniref:AraC family transcriptional regulator n=1 Tax=unclassified Microcoleus TaxID=2642155 RepID=UPI001DBBB9EB|nr:MULTISPECIES: AraC family transcriptional regulator [unclassified Microcoleus]MCC3506788.1 helix-turn-helix transcriptional regulator [Microcoleus sp. PH2017_19_SFW_U_A]MCC3521857.1 helix-turn-helix transcriptional regulator [Microcoleus sp. PH2017_20_SFW_D_A]MCC3552822.1 helix-turn-helix transcriptional regulator [Microcoleus sp. PH2017_35_SFW_U_B]MCC3568559.1 helix-turn-helix transcriptional regulator [Microcoleus sp. PH2017_31_RDM_U_A]MCC3580835.1 helix-turn-helix transcriptional regulat